MARADCARSEPLHWAEESQGSAYLSVRESDLGHAVQRREHQSQRVLHLWNLQGKHSKARPCDP